MNRNSGIQIMKRKEIEFDAEALVGSVEAMAAHVRGQRKLTLRAWKNRKGPVFRPLLS
jgi:hypothetical protein